MSMDCRQFLEELSDYIEGDAAIGIREAIQEHIAFCHKCEVLYNSTQRTLEIVSECTRDPLPLPEDVSQRLYSRLRSKIKERSGPQSK